MAKSIGFKKFEWSHLWIYWGVENPIRAYTQRDGKWVMLWPPDTKATSDTYLSFLKQFLPAFHQFLTAGEHPGRPPTSTSPTSRAAASTSRTTSAPATCCASWPRG